MNNKETRTDLSIIMGIYADARQAGDVEKMREQVDYITANYVEKDEIIFNYTVRIETEDSSTYRFIINATSDKEAISIAENEYDLAPEINLCEIESKYPVKVGLISSEGFED